MPPNFGLKVGMVGTVKFEARIRELVENLPDLAALVEPLLIVRRVVREQLGILHRRLLAIVRDDDVCRRLMTVPGVGPVVALTYRVTVDVPARFRNQLPYLLTPPYLQSPNLHPDRPHPRMLVRSAKWSSQGLGDKDCQAPRDEEGNRCPGASVGRDHASHLGRWHRIPMDQGGRRSVRTVRDQIRYQRWNDVPRGTMDEVSSYGRLNLQSH